MHTAPWLLWPFPRMEWCCWWVLAAFLTRYALLHPLFEVTIHARPPHILSCELLHLGWPLCSLSTTLLRNLGGTTTLFPLNRQPSSMLKLCLRRWYGCMSLVTGNSSGHPCWTELTFDRVGSWCVCCWM